MRRATIFTLALALCAVVAAAQEALQPSYVKAAPAPPVTDPAASADRDADGSLDWEEFRNLFTKGFHVADRDGDEVLTGEEAKQLFQKSDLEKADLNKDGKVQYREFVAFTARVFLLTDTDSDGTLTPDEIQQGATKGESR
jgi:Ca2+-binding EF-hand superfamily protein